MNLHEYQAKQLFNQFNMPVGNFEVASNAQEAADALVALGGSKWVAKAQVHAGGRGKAGGVKLIDNADQVKEFANQLLGTRLVTHQTDADGQPVNQLIIEPCVATKSELYFSLVVDAQTQKLVCIASTEGGMDIEEVAENTPEKIITVHVDPAVGPVPYQARILAKSLGLTGNLAKEFTSLFAGAVKMFVEKDLSMIEINPLAITSDDHLLCMDAKVGVDGSAAYRQKDLALINDVAQLNALEQEAESWHLNYVALEGNIGCMVNGAGLAMATMDMIQLHGGNPANFLDVGGGVTEERVQEAFKIILSDSKVEAILVNIFGGIVRCDLIAQGIVNAAKSMHIEVPIVVRLQGNNADKAQEIFDSTDVNVISANELTDAVKQVIAAKN
jgi:succinyl-CoA synthetase beta subunit